jgi:hypothetical protein
MKASCLFKNLCKNRDGPIKRWVSGEPGEKESIQAKEPKISQMKNNSDTEVEPKKILGKETYKKTTFENEQGPR